MFIIPEVQFRPGRRNAWTTYGLIGLNVLFFAFTRGGSRESIRELGFTPSDWSVMTVFTSLFVHAGTLHLLGNMFFLYMFGESVEQALGHLKTLVLYLVAGICGHVLRLLTSGDSFIPSVGASGAICGLAGLYAVLFRREWMVLHVFVFWLRVWRGEVPALVGVGAWLAEQAVLGMFSAMLGVRGGTGYGAHVSGLVVGLVIGVILVRKQAPASPKHVSGHAPTIRCSKCGGEARFAVDNLFRCKKCGAWVTRAGTLAK